MDPQLKKAIAAKKAREAKMLDPLRIQIRAEVETSEGEFYYVDTCLGMIQSQHRDDFKAGKQVPYSQQADGTKRWATMI